MKRSPEKGREKSNRLVFHFFDGSANQFHAIYIFLLTSHFPEVCLLLYACCLKVVESVNELAQIMKDLSVLVIDQVYKILINCH